MRKVRYFLPIFLGIALTASCGGPNDTNKPVDPDVPVNPDTPVDPDKPVEPEEDEIEVKNLTKAQFVEIGDAKRAEILKAAEKETHPYTMNYSNVTEEIGIESFEEAYKNKKHNIEKTTSVISVGGKEKMTHVVSDLLQGSLYVVYKNETPDNKEGQKDLINTHVDYRENILSDGSVKTLNITDSKFESIKYTFDSPLTKEEQQKSKAQLYQSTDASATGEVVFHQTSCSESLAYNGFSNFGTYENLVDQGWESQYTITENKTKGTILFENIFTKEQVEEAVTTKGSIKISLLLKGTLFISHELMINAQATRANGDYTKQRSGYAYSIEDYIDEKLTFETENITTDIENYYENKPEGSYSFPTIM